MKLKTVLSVDDNEDDQFLLQRAWKKCEPPVKLQLVCDGEKAIHYLSGDGDYQDRTLFPAPDFLLLDLKMPRRNGFEVLDWIRREWTTETRPSVAVFTSSQNTGDIKRAYELGAQWYLTKPVSYSELIQLVQLICGYLDTAGKAPSSSPHYRPPPLD